MLHNYLVMSKGNEDFLLVYYLERGMFSEASEVTKKLKAVSAVSYCICILTEAHRFKKTILYIYPITFNVIHFK